MNGFKRVGGRVKGITVLAAVIGALLAVPSFASAASCDYNGSGTLPDPSLVDSAGYAWDIHKYDASVDDGYNSAGQDDAFDGFSYLDVSFDGQTFKRYSNPDINACSTEEGGREIVFPDDVVSAPGVTLGRRVYVPATGLAFARYVDSITNTTDSDKSLTYQWGGELGSDGNTAVGATSSGDVLMDASDNWVNTFEATGGSTDPPLTTVWDGSSAPVARASIAGRWAVGYPDHSATSDELGAEYKLTLGPGQTKRFMHVIALRPSPTDSAVAAATIATEPAELWAGLDDSEIDTIQNWTFDADGDGVRTSVDNCPVDVNAGQENLDGDAKGDVCDEDIDGDGLSNATEQALRSDPRKADTDGDGKSDNADSCPTIAAGTEDGCLAPVVIPQVDKTAPVASIAVAKKLSLKTLLRRGFAMKLGSNEPAAFEVEVAAAAKSARLAQVGDLVVSAKRLAIGSGTRSVKLTIAKKFRKSLTAKTRLRVKVVAVDGAGNRTVKSIVLKLKR